jgi:hypothetical protein
MLASRIPRITPNADPGINAEGSYERRIDSLARLSRAWQDGEGREHDAVSRHRARHSSTAFWRAFPKPRASGRKDHPADDRELKLIAVNMKTLICSRSEGYSVTKLLESLKSAAALR